MLALVRQEYLLGYLQVLQSIATLPVDGLHVTPQLLVTLVRDPSPKCGPLQYQDCWHELPLPFLQALVYDQQEA